MEQIKYIVISLVSSFVLAPLIIGLLYKLKMRQQGKSEVDEVIQERKVKIGVPVMGGLIIVIPVLALYFVFGLEKELGYVPVLIVAFGAVVGFLDDFLKIVMNGPRNKSDEVYSKVNPIIYRNFITWSIYRYITAPFRIFTEYVDEAGSYQTGLKASYKLILEILLAFSASYFFYNEFGGEFWFPFVGSVDLGVISIVINALLMVGMAVGFSVADGLDALSPGTQAIGFAGLGFLAAILGHAEISYLCALIVGAELTFYYFNIPPARVEMSDVGTIPLGMLFILCGMYINRSFVTPIVGFIFVGEILSSFLQNIWAVVFLKRLFKMAPIHHHFEIVGWSSEKIVMRFYFAAMAAGLVGLLIATYL